MRRVMRWATIAMDWENASITNGSSRKEGEEPSGLGSGWAYGPIRDGRTTERTWPADAELEHFLHPYARGVASHCRRLHKHRHRY